MESFLKAEGGGKNICAVYAHNDDMAVGAIQAIKEAGLKPGKDIMVVSIDAVPDIFKAMADGEANATVELTPNMAGPAFDALSAFKRRQRLRRSGSRPKSKLYTPADDRRRSTTARRTSATDRAGATLPGLSQPRARRQMLLRNPPHDARRCRAFALTRTSVGVMPA